MEYFTTSQSLVPFPMETAYASRPDPPETSATTVTRTRRPDRLRRARQLPPGFCILQWTILGLGALVRLRQYFFDRSLWLDEASVALNLIHRGYGGLTRPLDLGQSAPIGWLWVEKASTQVFGMNEYALRLPQLLAALAGLWLALVLAGRHLRPIAATVVVFLVAASPSLDYYGSEFKPYGLDATVAVGLVLAADLLIETQWSVTRRSIVWATAASVAVLLSLPGLIVAGAATAVLAAVEFRRSPRAAAAWAATAAVWGAVFLAEYLRAVEATSSTPFMKRFWHTGFAPRPLKPGTTLSWLVHETWLVERNPLEASVPLLALLLAALGLVALARQARSRPLAAMLALTVTATIFAAVLAVYPFRERMTVFLVILDLVAVGAAADLVRRHWAPALLGSGAVVVAFAGTLPHSFDRLTHPYTRTEFREALQAAADQRRPGDQIWTYWRAVRSYEFYSLELGIRADGQFVLTPGACLPPGPVMTDLHPGQRIWLVFGEPPLYEARGSVHTYLQAFSTFGTVVFWRPEPGNGQSGYALFVVNRVPSPDSRVAIPPISTTSLTHGCLGTIHEAPPGKEG